jgi:hypothetical protein
MMKKLMFSAFLILGSMVVWAQSSAQVPQKISNSSNSRMEIKAKAAQMATGIMAAEAALSPAELAIAARVHLGNLPCESGTFVNVTAVTESPGYFDVQTKQQKYRMFPVETKTGAIRLEDHKAGAVWLQLANKSMLMNHKLGKRLADACMNPDQIEVAEKMLKNPAPGLLDIATEVATK